MDLVYDLGEISLEDITGSQSDWSMAGHFGTSIDVHGWVKDIFPDRKHPEYGFGLRSPSWHERRIQDLHRGASDWHRDNWIDDDGRQLVVQWMLTWASCDGTEMLLPTGEELTLTPGHLFLFNNRRVKHRTPANLNLSARWFYREHLIKGRMTEKVVREAKATVERMTGK